ncbi:carbohydrate kinase family protein [Candidatus Giovannonibacteria bacterium]|nr:carbohydrate kinase family protein [Candidatus Giovannonibacteria bacterium]
MEKYDFISIGDTVTDAFIKLKDTSAHLDIDKGTRELCMGFADKIPYEDVFVVPAVGNSANAAVAAARLGLKSALVSNVGGDYFGDECLEALRKENVGTNFVIKNTGRKTNYHYVLWYDDDRTILIKHEEYDYIFPDIDDPAWIYLSSAAENSLPFHDVLLGYLEARPNIKLAFQPGTFQMKFGKERLAGLYRRSDVFISNKEESERILKTEENDIKKLLEMIRALGPKIAVITDGVKGAYASDGEKALFMPPYPDPKPPLERTGAGDAFSSTFVAVIALGKSVEDALMRAPVNSMSVVQYVGAREGLLNMNQIEEFLKNAPHDYKPTSI